MEYVTNKNVLAVKTPHQDHVSLISMDIHMTDIHRSKTHKKLKRKGGVSHVTTL